MGARIRALIRKEMLAILRDPKSRLILIVPPIAQLLVFSFAATLEVKNARVGVLNADEGRWSLEVVRRVEAAPTFSALRFFANEQELRRAVDAQQVLAAVRIGPSFSRDLEAGRQAELQLVLDGRRSNAAQIVGGYLSEIVAGVGADAAPRARTGDAIVARNWFNPNLEFIWYTVPSLLALIAMLIGLLVTALSVARERELGTFDQLIVSPLRTHEILIGKAVPPLLLGLFHITIYLLVAVFVFDVPFRGSLLLLYAGAVAYLAALIGVGLFISSLSATQQQAILGAFLVLVPATLLSGFATPIENMPGWLQPLTLANPLRHFLVIVKGVFLKALPAAEVAQQIGPLVLIAAVTLGASAWLFRHRIE